MGDSLWTLGATVSCRLELPWPWPPELWVLFHKIVGLLKGINWLSAVKFSFIDYLLRRDLSSTRQGCARGVGFQPGADKTDLVTGLAGGSRTYSALNILKEALLLIRILENVVSNVVWIAGREAFESVAQVDARRRIVLLKGLDHRFVLDAPS